MYVDGGSEGEEALERGRLGLGLGDEVYLGMLVDELLAEEGARGRLGLVDRGAVGGREGPRFDGV